MSKVEDAVAADAATLGAMQINAFDANQPEPLFVEPYAVTGWATFIQRAASSRSGPQARVGVIRDDSGNVFVQSRRHSLSPLTGF